jgi:hypothetical protein
MLAANHPIAKHVYSMGGYWRGQVRHCGTAGGGQEERRMAEGAGLDAQSTAVTAFNDGARVQRSGMWARHRVALLATAK